jgi:hypothetical protein
MTTAVGRPDEGSSSCIPTDSWWGDQDVLVSPERFARPIIADEPVDEAVDASLDAMAQRLKRHGDDDHGGEGSDTGLLHASDEEEQRLQQRIRDGEHGRQRHRKRADDEATPDDEVYVPQTVVQDCNADRQRYQ